MTLPFMKNAIAAFAGLGLILGTGLGVTALPTAALAQSAAKATVDQAKVAGTVGEQGDGLLGLVNGHADSAVSAAVAEVNADRAKR